MDQVSQQLITMVMSPFLGVEKDPLALKWVFPAELGDGLSSVGL